MLFKLRDTMDGYIVDIFSVQKDGSRTNFLVHTKQFGWSWVDSSYYEPLEVRNLELLSKDVSKETAEFKIKTKDRN